MDETSKFIFSGDKGKRKKGMAYNLTENEIRYAMANTKSNAEACRFLRIRKETYKKYAKSYIDLETGKTLWELHKNQFGFGVQKPWTKNNLPYKEKIDTEDILNGKHSQLLPWYVKRRLIKEGYLEDKCHICGFQEHRAIDDKQPIVLDFLDGNNRNYKIDNIRLICYNCRFLYRGNIMGRKSTGKLTYVDKKEVAIGNMGIIRKEEEYKF